MRALTPVQDRTLRDLIGEGPAGSDAAGMAERCRAGLEESLAGLGLTALPQPLWLGKSALTDLERCEGMFEARVRRELPRFEHSDNTAAGALFHKAVEVDVGSLQAFDVRAVAEKAADRLSRDDRSFAAHWEARDDLDRFALLTEAARRIELFRASFPPLGRSGAAVPLPELKVAAEVAGGRVVLSGKIDLVLIRPDPGHGASPLRLAVDLKTGSPRSEHAEDMRLYALLIALRYGVPPYRVATFFLESGEWQPEDVTEQTLGRAADRVAAAARTALSLLGGKEPVLRLGPYCGWCPRAPECPAFAEARAASAATP